MKKTCPVCQDSKISKKITFNRYNLLLCQNCTFEFISPPKSKDKDLHIYNEGYFHGELSGAKGYADYSKLQDQLIKEAIKKINYIQRYTTKKKLLDLGAGTGIFLKEARNRGYQVAGNDISTYAIKHLKQNKIKSFSGSIEKKVLPKQEFDIITAWDVLEHLYKPIEAIQNINSALNAGGFLFLTTPDTKSIDARLLGKNWYGYKKIPEHVSFFNSSSITRLLTDANFEVIEVRPWGFYRNLDFIFNKIQIYSSIFLLLERILTSFTRLKNMTFFIPLTDSIIVAKKYEK